MDVFTLSKNLSSDVLTKLSGGCIVGIAVLKSAISVFLGDDLLVSNMLYEIRPIVVQIKARPSDINEYFNKFFHFLNKKVNKVKRQDIGIPNIPIAIIVKINVLISYEGTDCNRKLIMQNWG